ncbi:MAG: serine/threonine-protein phosphatase [Planctomycetes bacterium]|nr:serine/threonine-protein phosphatase [Planctomycetota bacterium]
MSWEFCARTDVGRTRERNEDNYLVFRSGNHSGPEPRAGGTARRGAIGSLSPDVLVEEAAAGLLVVADGMGGHANGNIASLAAVESIRDWFEKRRESPADPNRDWVENEEIRDLATAIGRANFDIFRRNRGAFSIEGMGTTVVALLLFQRYAVTACVGDSRIYLQRNGALKQVTKDHSLIEELIRYNIIGEQDAFLNPNKNIITRALGMNETVEVDTQILDVRAGDIWLLCSDGLTDMVEDRRIEATLRDANPKANLGDVASRLVDLANHRGGIDNITVVLARAAAGPQGS